LSVRSYWKETGHLLKNCELLNTNNRRKINEQGNANGSSKSDVQQGSERVLHISNISISKDSIDKNVLKARPVMVNLNKHS